MRLLLGALALWLIATTVQAQAPTQRPNCFPSPVVEQVLSEKFNMRPVLQGPTDSGFLMQLWAAPTGAWTLLFKRPDDLSCHMAEGDGLALVPIIQPPAPSIEN